MPFSQRRRPALILAGLAFLSLLSCNTPAPETPPSSDAVEQAQPMPLDAALALLDERDDWAEHGPMPLPRHPAEKYLKGWTIALDPGHGGDAHLPNYKRGPTGVREAEINWRVAVLLQKLLTDAGARVVMTRDGDVDVGLAQRAAIANDAGADLFISLHHNASSRPTTNYGSVWYHGHVDDAEPALDAARYIAHRLGAELRTDVGLTSPLMSDQQMYANGFGVLRACEMPAILCESSFHSNPDEEQRLRDAGYNLREAYAIYTALCEYAYGGRPTQTEPVVEAGPSRVRITTVLDDGLPAGWWGSDRQRILSSTIMVTLDGRRLPHRYDPATRVLTAEAPLSRVEPGPHELHIRHANLFKHHNWPQRYDIAMPHTDPTPAHPDRPWLGLPRLDGAPTLVGVDASLDGLFDMPEGSAMTVARVDPATGRLLTARWRDTGDLGFYPASTVKWVTAAMTLELMQAHDMRLDTVLQVGDDPPRSMRDLLAGMIVMSDNQAFNTLQEAVGFGETYERMKSWGCTKAMIRRHFTRPHWSHSREVRIHDGGRLAATIAPRPAPDIPLNADPNPEGNPESNWFTTDDLVRCAAAMMMGPTRDRPHFDELCAHLGYTNQGFIRDGLAKLTAQRDDRPAFVTLNKPGWWPGDGANVDLAYVYDVNRREHYLIGLYVQGTLEEAKAVMAEASRAVFAAIHDGGLRLDP